MQSSERTAVWVSLLVSMKGQVLHAQHSLDIVLFPLLKRCIRAPVFKGDHYTRVREPQTAWLKCRNDSWKPSKIKWQCIKQMENEKRKVLICFIVTCLGTYMAHDYYPKRQMLFSDVSMAHYPCKIYLSAINLDHIHGAVLSFAVTVASFLHINQEVRHSSL